MNILKSIRKIPGGIMLVPLLLGALVHTFTPGAGQYFGGFTNGLISGTVPILAVWFFCMGASINIKASGMVLRKSGTIVVTKILVAWVVGIVAMQFLPVTGIIQGWFICRIFRSSSSSGNGYDQRWSLCFDYDAIWFKRRS